MNNTIQSTNFKGGFLLNYYHTKPKIRRQLEHVIGMHGVQVFDKFNGKDYAVFYILNNPKDIKMADFLANNNKIRFQYYPDINTKNQFNSQNPEELVEYIKIKHPKCIKILHEMQKIIYKRNDSILSKRHSDIDLAKGLLKKYGFNFSEDVNLQDDGVVIIKNTKGSGLLKMTPPNVIGLRYVYIEPNNSYDDSIRCLVTSKGLVLKDFKTPDEMSRFREGFTRLVQNYET